MISALVTGIVFVGSVQKSWEMVQHVFYPIWVSLQSPSHVGEGSQDVVPNRAVGSDVRAFQRRQHLVAQPLQRLDEQSSRCFFNHVGMPTRTEVQGACHWEGVPYGSVPIGAEATRSSQWYMRVR